MVGMRLKGSLALLVGVSAIAPNALNRVDYNREYTVKIHPHEGCHVDRFVTEHISLHSKGFHLVCASDAPAHDGVAVRFWRHSRAHAVDIMFRRRDVTDSNADTLMPRLLRALVHALSDMPLTNKWHHPELKQPPALFSAVTRERLLSLGDVLRASRDGGVLFLEGGQYMLPSVRIGFRQTLRGVPGIANTDAGLEIETLSLEPAIFSVRNFISEAECAAIVREAAPHVHSSGVSLTDADQGRQATDWRTSSQTWLKSAESATARRLDVRIENMTGIPRVHQEDVQVLRYLNGQFYDHHTDGTFTFDRKCVGSPSMLGPTTGNREPFAIKVAVIIRSCASVSSVSLARRHTRPCHS